MARGWCPGVWTPMAAADGLLVRVKPRQSRLQAAAARRIAAAVDAYGHGRIELTSRANLQVRGLTPAGARAFAAAMLDCGVADADPAVERRRNLVVSPWDDDACPEAVALEAALAASGLWLPAKFGFSVSGRARPMGDVAADIAIEVGAGACAVAIAGSRRQARGGSAAAIALACAFVALGGLRRMRDLVDEIGDEAIYAAAGLCAAPTEPTPAWMAATDLVGIAPGDGGLTPRLLREAADRAERSGDGVVRVTPWRSLLIGRPDQAMAA